MLLTSNKLHLAAIGVAALAVLGGTTALAASHRSAAPKAAAPTAVDQQGEHQDAGETAKSTAADPQGQGQHEDPATAPKAAGAAADRQGQHEDTGPAAHTADGGADPAGED
jgi:hypothetical protein